MSNPANTCQRVDTREQVEIFEGSSKTVQTEINNWLKEKDGYVTINSRHIAAATTVIAGHNVITIAIFYKPNAPYQGD